MTYAVLTTQSTIQVPAPGLVIDALSTTVTADSGVTATLALPATFFDTTQGTDLLLRFAEALDTIMASGKVASATGGQAADPSGLLQDVIDFVVAYPSAAAGALAKTMVVEVPCAMIGGNGLGTGHSGPEYAMEQIDLAYAKLAAIAQGG
jgi:hypothetical protein